MKFLKRFFRALSYPYLISFMVAMQIVIALGLVGNMYTEVDTAVATTALALLVELFGILGLMGWIYNSSTIDLFEERLNESLGLDNEQ